VLSEETTAPKCDVLASWDLNEFTFIDKCGEQLLVLPVQEEAIHCQRDLYKHIIEPPNVRRNHSWNVLGFLWCLVFRERCWALAATAEYLPHRPSRPHVEVIAGYSEGTCRFQCEWVGTLEGYVNRTDCRRK